MLRVLRKRKKGFMDLGWYLCDNIKEKKKGIWVFKKKISFWLLGECVQCDFWKCVQEKKKRNVAMSVLCARKKRNKIRKR